MGGENKDNAAFCVSCGTSLTKKVTVELKEKSKSKRTFYTCGAIAALFIVLAIVIPIGICAIIGYQEEQESKALEITGSSMTHNSILGWTKVTGTVKNTGSSEISSHGISAKFYNSEDVLLDTGTDYVQNIAPGEEAQFTIYGYEAGVVRYEVYVDSW